MSHQPPKELFSSVTQHLAPVSSSMIRGQVENTTAEAKLLRATASRQCSLSRSKKSSILSKWKWKYMRIQRSTHTFFNDNTIMPLRRLRTSPYSRVLSTRFRTSTSIQLFNGVQGRITRCTGASHLSDLVQHYISFTRLA